MVYFALLQCKPHMKAYVAVQTNFAASYIISPEIKCSLHIMFITANFSLMNTWWVWSICNLISYDTKTSCQIKTFKTKLGSTLFNFLIPCRAVTKLPSSAMQCSLYEDQTIQCYTDFFKNYIFASSDVFIILHSIFMLSHWYVSLHKSTWSCVGSSSPRLHLQIPDVLYLF